MIDSWPACHRGCENRAGRGRRAKPMPKAIGKPEDEGPAKVCSAIRGCGGRGSVIYLMAALVEKGHEGRLEVSGAAARRLDRALERARRAREQELAVGQHDDLLRVALRLLDVVGRVDDRGSRA